jgi:two-component system, OmpR family, response regulator MprA
MSARFDREDRVEREVEQPRRLVFPPFRSHYAKGTGRYAAGASVPRAKEQRQQRILFIEDDRFIADMYRLGLEVGGWEVDVAHDGEEGLRRALEDPPALVLLDMLLPRMDGFEVLRRLRENAVTRDVPVLVVSNASGLGGREEEAHSLGIVDWMVKANTTPAALANRVRRILTRD